MDMMDIAWMAGIWREWFSGRMGEEVGSQYGNLDLYNIIFDPVNDIFIDSFFIGKPRQGQVMRSGKGKDCLILKWDIVPVSFVETSDIVYARLNMQPGFLWEKRDLDK